MKKFFSSLFLVSIITCLFFGCSQNKQNYNISQDFKNKANSIVKQIDAEQDSELLSDQLDTDVTSFIKSVDGNAKYTKDEQDLAMQIFNYYGQTILVEKAKLTSTDDYNKQKAEADKMRNKINQYLN